MMNQNRINYSIGENYRYPNSNKKFKLVSVSKNHCNFYFDCGHWCTDNVFIDLIRIKIGVRVLDDLQLKLQLHD